MTRSLTRSIGAALIGLSLAAGAGRAQQVELRAIDGGLTLTGRIAAFDGSRYRLDTRVGTVSVPAADVRCAGEACAPPSKVASDVAISGSPGLLRRPMPELVDAYSLSIDTDITRAAAPEGAVVYRLLPFDGGRTADITLTPGDSEAALAALASGDAALAITSRPVTEAEAATLFGADRSVAIRLGLEVPLGVTGLIVAVGSDVPVTALRRMDLARIVSGELRNWSALGGPDKAISVFTRKPGSVARELLDRDVMRPSGRAAGPAVIAVDTDKGVAEAVARFSNSIGITTWEGRGGARPISIYDACGLPVRPDAFTLRSGAYPLAAPVTAYVAPLRAGLHARGLLDFATSPEGGALMRAAGYAPANPVVAESRPPDDAPALGAEARPLSLGFAIPDGAAPLTPEVEADMKTLAAFLRDGGAADRELVFVARGPAGAGRPDVAAAERARAALLARLPDPAAVSVRAEAAEGPGAGCVLGLQGTRVEVWLRPGSDG